MQNIGKFRKKLLDAHVCLGTAISFSDSTVTEALCNTLDFVWIDMEHTSLSLESVERHVMATKGTETVPMVRVAWNDPVLIKPVLDLGAFAVIIPLIRTAEDACRAVAACLYPPEGIRGYGPRRPSNYGLYNAADFCRDSNAAVFPIVQIEHYEAVENINAIVNTPRLASILIGPNDLANSMGFVGQPGHPEVVRAIEGVIRAARDSSVFVGIGTGDNVDTLVGWIKRGVQWLTMGADCTLLINRTQQIGDRVREALTV